MARLYLAIGSLNREAPYFQGARGEGLTICSFDPATGDAARICGTDSADNPTFLSVDAASGVIYANSEVFGWHEGTVSAYRFDPAAGALIYLNKQPARGSITAYNMVTPDRRFLLLANYAMGSGGPDQSLVSLPICANGNLGPVAAEIRHDGALGPDKDRQERPHPHCIVAAPGGLFLSADLGLDQVIAYRLSDDGAFQPVGAVSMPAGAGPRHIAPHHSGRFAFVSNELDSTVSIVGIEEDSLTLRQTLPSVPDGAASHGADIHLSPDGRFLYASNRGHDSIASFAVDQTTGEMTSTGWTASGGETPRNFALTPDGGWLLVANQNGDRITLFRRDAETGALTDSGKAIDIGTPVCIRPFIL
ncbi:MAG: lactonase family protein [Paracoccus sp. (in: a-proteobacteria)]